MTKLTKDQAITYLQALFFDLDESEVVAMALAKHGGAVAFTKERFFKEFQEYKAETHIDQYYQFELSKKAYGIKFICLLTPAEVVDLRESHPGEFIYIQKYIQEVAV